MQVAKLTDMADGWFIGSFAPSVYRTSHAEVCYRTHPMQSAWPKHFHKLGTEITLVVRGVLKLNGTEVHAGDIVTVHPREIIKPEFMTDCEVVVVKLPSIPGDKYEVSPCC